MPIKKAAFKHLRQTKRRTERNRATKDNLRSLYKKIRLSLDAKKQEEAQTIVRTALKAIDKARQHGVLKKNAAARRKSRLMQRLRRMEREATTP